MIKKMRCYLYKSTNPERQQSKLLDRVRFLRLIIIVRFAVSKAVYDITTSPEDTEVKKLRNL